MPIEPVTHLEKTIAGTVEPVTHLEKVIEQYGGGGGGGGSVTAADLDDSFKDALLDCIANVAWDTEDGQQYYDALEAALYPLDRITAVYTQSGTVYDTDSLDSLKTDLVVTAFYQGGGSKIATDYTLSGTLEVGTSTITVSYRGKTTTFNVTVSQASYVTDGLVAFWDGINNTGSAHDSSAKKWVDTISGYEFVQNGTSRTYSFGDNCLNFTTTASGSTIAKDNTLKCANIGLSRTVEVVFEAEGTEAQCIGDLTGADKGNAQELNKHTFSVFPADGTVMVKGGASDGNMQSDGISGVRSLSGVYDASYNCTGKYINGAPGTTGSHSHSLSGQTSGYMIIGASPNNFSYPFKGKIYAIRIYNRELTAQEVAANYAVDVDRFGLGA